MAIENLYTFIYRRAWDHLDESSRRALLAMPLLRPEGDTLDFLGTLSQLDPGELHSSIQKLALLNLVEVRGDLHRRIYSIHSLTRAFLLEQVARWL
ncbi:MAG: hypothetical protein HC802_01695 [Caldilineaceae bacterium]|nr:hypothetical protein [Caldilineaceae bacterium]